MTVPLLTLILSNCIFNIRAILSVLQRYKQLADFCKQPCRDRYKFQHSYYFFLRFLVERCRLCKREKTSDRSMSRHYNR